MTYDNTLLGCCLVAYEAAFEEAIATCAGQPKPDVFGRQAVNPIILRFRHDLRRRGVAAVLEHLAAELVLISQSDPQMTVHELARRLELEAAGKLTS